MNGSCVLLRLAVALVFCGLAWLNSGADVEATAGETSAGKRIVHGGGVYRAPLLNNPPTLDPAYVNDIYGVAVVQQLFDGLVQFSPDLLVTPAIAENWQVEDGGKAYRFILRGDARFHDGRRVASADVSFSLRRLLRVDPPPSILPHLLKITGSKDYMEHKTEEVAGLKIVDDRTLLIRLDEPYVPFVVALGMYQAKIVPREVVEADPRGFGARPVGTGPFKFSSWEENKRIRLQSFPDYYAGRPLLDEVEFIVYPGIGIEEVWSDFQSGRLDQMIVYGDVREKLKGREDIQWVRRPSLSLQFYGFNCEHPLLKDRDLREALNEAVDRDKLVAEVYKGQYQVARSILPPGLPGYHPREQKPGGDVSGAVELARRALGGRSLPVPIEIVSNSQSPQARAELEFIRKSWAPLGIDLQTKFLPDWSQFEQYLQSDSMMVYRYVWFADIPDADDVLRPLFSAGSQFNYTRYRNAEVDEMLRIASGMVDPVRRAEAYQQAEGKIMKSSPVIPIIHVGVDYVYQPKVQGIEASALGAHTRSYHRVWLKE